MEEPNITHKPVPEKTAEELALWEKYKFWLQKETIPVMIVNEYKLELEQLLKKQSESQAFEPNSSV